MTEFSPREIVAYYKARIPDLTATKSHEWRTKCPVHNGDDNNFAIDSTSGLSHCHSRCQKGWDILGLEMELSRLDFIKAKQTVFRTIGRPEPPYSDRDVIATYDYTDAEGTLVYQVVRKYPKRFGLRRPDGRGGWLWNLDDTARLPFNLLQVTQSPYAFLVEGERDVLTLKARRIVASCNSEGAGKWKPELTCYFAGKDVVIVPDNDGPGREHALKVAHSLLGTATRIRILEIPNLPAKGDISDFFVSGRTVEELRQLAKSAQDFTPSFSFVSEVPNEEDKWVRKTAEIVRESGGLDEFWNLATDDGIPTPFVELTEDLSGGLRKGEVYILGGRTGSGKTSLLLQFVQKALTLNWGTLLFSLEMNQQDVVRRLISIEERVDLAQLRILQRKRKLGELSSGKDEMLLSNLLRKLARGTRVAEKLPLLVHQRPSVNPQYLIDETKRLSERQKLDLICVDHMQLMSADSNERKEYEKFTAISRALKASVARELSVPVLVVSQVTRSNFYDKRTELEFTDLRGSGAMEEDVAAALLLYHDGEDIKKAVKEGRVGKGPVRAHLKLAKNRFGQSGTYLELVHWKGFTRFETLDPRDHRPEEPLQAELGQHDLSREPAAETEFQSVDKFGRKVPRLRPS